MTELSPRFALPLLQAGQAQKEVFHNEALIRLDTAVHSSVVRLSTATPPAAPTSGACWIVGDDAYGEWRGKAGSIAAWTDAGWRFVAPFAGMQTWLEDRKRWAWHDGSGWRDDPFPVAGLSVDGIRVLGPQCPPIAGPVGGATVDAEARNVLTAILATLSEHGLIKA